MISMIDVVLLAVTGTGLVASCVCVYDIRRCFRRISDLEQKLQAAQTKPELSVPQAQEVPYLGPDGLYDYAAETHKKTITDWEPKIDE